MFDSTATTKDLLTGVHISPAGQSSTLDEGGLTALPSTLLLQTFYLKSIRIYPPPPPRYYGAGILRDFEYTAYAPT